MCLVRLSLSVFLAGGLLLAAAGSAEPPGFEVSVASGLSPRMSANEVAQVVLSRLAGPQAVAKDQEGNVRLVPGEPEIVKMECVSGDPWKGHRLGAVEERIGPDVVWVVHAKGTFVSRRSGPDGPIVKSYGFYVIDDATGKVVAKGSLGSMRPQED